MTQEWGPRLWALRTHSSLAFTLLFLSDCEKYGRKNISNSDEPVNVFLEGEMSFFTRLIVVYFLRATPGTAGLPAALSGRPHPLPGRRQLITGISPSTEHREHLAEDFLEPLRRGILDMRSFLFGNLPTWLIWSTDSGIPPHWTSVCTTGRAAPTKCLICVWFYSCRMSATQCLKHEWLNNLPAKASKSKVRLKSQLLLQKYMAQRTWKVSYPFRKGSICLPNISFERMVTKFLPTFLTLNRKIKGKRKTLSYGKTC